jgi:hypothetical protein
VRPAAVLQSNRRRLVTIEPELLELFGAPSILGGADVGAIVFAFGLGELFAQVGDSLS